MAFKIVSIKTEVNLQFLNRIQLNIGQLKFWMKTNRQFHYLVEKSIIRKLSSNLFKIILLNGFEWTQ